MSNLQILKEQSGVGMFNVGNMSHISADRDSLVALDALLRIGGSRPVKTENTGAQTTAKPLEPNPSSTSSAKPNPEKETGTNSKLARGNAGILLPHMENSSYSPAQLAAFQAASYGNTLVSGANFSVHSAAAHLLQRQTGHLQTAAAADARDKNSQNEGLVRKEKVEAALRSKPQRGRKREDLSEKERLELTRTRNREHAKSTRIRKKARYQELLDFEQKLKGLEKAETLRINRCDSILTFLSIRQKMVTNAAAESSHASTVSALDEVVCSVSNFQFEILSLTNRRNLLDDGNDSSDLSNMKEWDMQFVKRVIQSYGPGAERFLEFQVIGGEDGVALSKDGNGFAHIEIILNVNEPRLILTATLSFRFAPESNQIRSAVWTTAQEYCAPPEPLKRSSSSAPENLGCQLVHPSVVSLDPDKALPDEDESNTPGMNI